MKNNCYTWKSEKLHQQLICIDHMLLFKLYSFLKSKKLQKAKINTRYPNINKWRTDVQMT